MGCFGDGVRRSPVSVPMGPFRLDRRTKRPDATALRSTATWLAAHEAGLAEGTAARRIGARKRADGPDARRSADRHPRRSATGP